MARTFIVSEINGENFLNQNVTLDIKGAKIYAFVCGMDYHDFWSFKPYADDFKTKILTSKREKEVIIFYYVDVLTGKIIKIEYSENNKPIETITKFDPVTDKNYINHRFTSNGKKIVSKIDVYKLVEQISIDFPNCLEELHIFSHAVSDGPMLVNSDEYLDDTRTKINTDDHDFRVSDLSNKKFDFTKFKNAFSSNGIIKIWGCNNHPPFNNLIKQIMKNPKYKKDGTTPDDTIFTIKDIQVYKYKISPYVNAKYRTAVISEAFKMTMLQIKQLLANSYCSSYSSWLCYSTGINVQATLPATYALFSSPKKFRVSEDTKDNTPFYKAYLNITMGELDYGIYDVSTIDRLLKI